MQPVPALGLQRFAAKLVVAGHAPDVGADFVFRLQNLLRAQSFVQNRPAAEELHRRFAVARFELVDSAQDAFAASGRHIRHRIVFVVQRDVVKEVFFFLIHAAQAILNDDSDFIHVGGIVSCAGGNGAGQNQAVSVLMLQAFAVQRGSASRPAKQEAFATRIRERPDGVANTLESEHRIVGKKRNHRHTIVRVGRACGGHGRHRSGFRDAFFQNLPVFFLTVIQEHVLIVRLIELSLAGVDADLTNNGFHAEGSAFVGDNWDDQLADGRFLHQISQQTDEAHCR